MRRQIRRSEWIPPAILAALAFMFWFPQWVEIETAKETSGVVLSTDVTGVPAGRHARHVPEVEYRYRVDGREFLGSEVYPTRIGFGHHATALDVASRFRIGQSYTVYYCAASPDDAFLIPKYSHGASLLLLTLAGLWFASVLLITYLGPARLSRLAECVLEQLFIRETMSPVTDRSRRDKSRSVPPQPSRTGLGRRKRQVRRK